MSAVKRKTHPILISEAILSCAMAAIWVGSYGYRYNDPFYNSSPVNWLAFFLWAPGLFLTMRIYWLFARLIKMPWRCIAVTWMVYFASLLQIEHIGYNVLAIRQITSEGPLLFGLIHGTPVLKTFYLTAGILAVPLSISTRQLLTRSGILPEFFEKLKNKNASAYDYRKKLNKAL